MEKTKGIILILISGFCFGFMPVFGKIAYANGSNNYTVLAYRFIFAAIMLFIYLKAKRVSLKVSRSQFIQICIFTVLGYVTCSVTYFASFNHITVGLATMLLFTHPALVVVFDFIIYKEKLYSSKIISICLTSLGLFFLVDIGGSSFNLLGVILAILSSVSYAVYILGISNKEMKKVDSFVLTFYVCLLSSIVVLIISIFNGKFIYNQNFISLGVTFLLALISTLIAMLTFVQGTKIIGPSNAAIFSTVEPIVSLIFGVILFKEILTIKLIIGSMLVISSILILAKKKESI